MEIVSPFCSMPQWRVSKGRKEGRIPTAFAAAKHVVEGIECREVEIDIDVVGTIRILEATASSQDTLVEMALALDEDELPLAGNILQSGDPYGFVLWPAASAAATHLLTKCGSSDTKKPLEGLTILELGSGTGLVSIAASLGGASRILATDIESAPLTLLAYASKNLNQCETQIESSEPRTVFVQGFFVFLLLIFASTHVGLLDLKDFSTPLPPADIVVAADIMYEPSTGRAMARRVAEALRRGSRVVVGDSPGRAGRPAFLEELGNLGVKHAAFVDTIGRTCSGPRHELICGKGSTSVTDSPEALSVAIMDLQG